MAYNLVINVEHFVITESGYLRMPFVCNILIRPYFVCYVQIFIELHFAVFDKIQLLPGDTWNISAETNWS